MRRRRRPLVDGWVCPRCGQIGTRHGRGGARACKDSRGLPTCLGLRCTCEDGLCFSKGEGYGWRRSPCRHAVCSHCGWTGEVRSKTFEREFGLSRCPKSSHGGHLVRIEAVGSVAPTVLRLRLTCVECGLVGWIVADPAIDVDWLPIT